MRYKPYSFHAHVPIRKELIAVKFLFRTVAIATGSNLEPF